MTTDDRHRAVEAARLRTELSVQQLWLSYLALGGSEDAFDVDGYLQGLMPLEGFQQDVLAQAVNEALEELCRSLRVPLSAIPPRDEAVDGALGTVIDRLLARRQVAPGSATPPLDPAQPTSEGQPPPRSPGSQPER